MALSASFVKCVAGRNDDLNTHNLEGGARIHYVLQDIFVRGLQSLDPTEAMSEEDIRTAIQNAAGTRGTLLLPEEPFEVLVKQAIKKMNDPCLKAARIVHDELNRISSALLKTHQLSRYPRLASAIETATREFLSEGLDPAEAMIGSLVDCQLAHINTTHPDFVGGSVAMRLAQRELRARRGGDAFEGEFDSDEEEENGGGDGVNTRGGGNGNGNSNGNGNGRRAALRDVNGRSKKLAKTTTSALKKEDGATATATASPPGGKLYSHEDGVVSLKEPPGKIQASEPQTNEELLQVLVTRILLGSYFSISRGVLADTVPKAVMHFLVNSVQRGLQQYLIQTLYDPATAGVLLQEHPDAEAKRVAVTSKYHALTQAAHAIGTMPAELAAAAGAGGHNRR
jgi:dynamin 1-like protein